MISEVKVRVEYYTQEFKLVYCFYLFIVYTDFVYDTVFVFTIANVHDVVLFKIPSQKV